MDVFDQISAPSVGGDIFDKVAPTKSTSSWGLPAKVAKGIGGVAIGAAEIAANLATQTYGLPARGYGEIANLVTGRTDLADKASSALIYEPQTDWGKAGMDAIGSAFNWWHQKSMAVGEPVREAVSKVAGETAGNIAGATVASTMEAAPLFLGEVYGKAKGKVAERRTAKDSAEIKSRLAEDARVQKESDLSRANLGEVIPEDPVKVASAREAATRQYGGDIFDRIQRGYLGDVVEEGAPKPFISPEVKEYAGPRKPPPKELAPPPTTPKDTLPPATRGEVSYQAEAAKLPGKVEFKGLQDTGIPGKPPVPIFEDTAGVGSFVAKPGETVDQAYARAKTRYEKAIEPLINEAGSSKAVTDAARGLKEFWSPLSTIPMGKEYMALRYKDLLGGLTRVDRIVGDFSKRFKNLSVQDKADVFNAIRGEIPMDTLPEETRIIAKQTHADIERVGALLVRRGLLKKEVFEANKDNYIHYMYLRHILPDDASIPVGRGGRLDLSYLKARKDLPESVRQELGLIEDVSVAAPVGMGKALGDVVKADFFSKVSSNPEWVWQPSKEIAKLKSEYTAYKQIVERGENVSPEVTAKYRQLEADLTAATAAAGKAPTDFVQLPDSKAYGELQGAFVRKEIANDIVPVYSINPAELEGLARAWNKAGRGFDVGMTMFKVGKVALNPPTMIRNTISNFIQMNMSGIPIYRIPGAVIDGVNSVMAKDKFYRTLQNNGGFKTNFSVAELGEVLKAFEKAKGGTVDKIFMAVSDLAKYYGKIDDIAKMSLFKDAVTRQGMSTSDAVMYAQKWGMDYSLASRSVKHARRYVLPFVSYQYKIAPLIAESLVKRPWVIAKYAAVPYLMAKYAADKYDWTDKQLDKAQKMMAERTKGQGAYTLLPIKDNKGNIEIVNLEYFLPWGNWLEAARDLKGGNYIDTAKQFGGLVGPYGNVITMLNTKREGEAPKDPFTGQPVYSKLDSPKDKYLKQIEWWWQLFAPSSISSNGALGYTAKAIAGAKDKWGTEATGAKAFGRWMGVNVGSLDPRSVLVARKAQLKQLDVEIMKIMRDPKYDKQDRKDAIKQLQIERQKILNPE